MLPRRHRKRTDAEKVLATEGNLNNDIGMPLMLLRLRERHRYAVIEMGMNHAGEISYLTRLARPGVALITNAGAAHVEGLGSVEAVARAKGEIFEGLSPGELPSSMLMIRTLHYGANLPVTERSWNSVLEGDPKP